MTGSEIVTKFINMVDDELDADYLYQLMNDAKNEIEEQRNWEILKEKVNITATTTPLPSDFNFDTFLTDGSSKYTKISKEEQNIKNYGSYNYYLDIKNDNIVIVNYNDDTLYLYYQIISPDITATTEWVFPSRCHTILSYKMAQIYYASDAGEKGRSWDDRWDIYYNQKLQKMEMWDDKLKIANKMPRKYGKSPMQI